MYNYIGGAEIAWE